MYLCPVLHTDGHIVWTLIHVVREADAVEEFGLGGVV